MASHYAYWDRTTIIDAIRSHNQSHSKPPTSNQWMTAGPEHPACLTVYHHFGSWNNAIQAAGFTPRRRWYTSDAEPAPTVPITLAAVNASLEQCTAHIKGFRP